MRSLNAHEWASLAAVIRAASFESHSPVLEILDRPLVLLRRLAARERPQIFALPRLLICVTAVDTKFAGFEFTNHVPLDAARPVATRPRCSSVRKFHS